MDTIPVTFSLNSVEVKGTLQQVSGAGDVMFHLMVNDRYLGQLLFISDGPGLGWKFFSNVYPQLNELGDYFGNIVELWVE